MKWDILANEIDGKIFLYENNEVFIETSLEGSIDNPKIIIDGKIFGNEKQEGQDLKKIFQQGINSVFDSLLQIE